MTTMSTLFVRPERMSVRNLAEAAIVPALSESGVRRFLYGGADLGPPSWRERLFGTRPFPLSRNRTYTDEHRELQHVPSFVGWSMQRLAGVAGGARFLVRIRGDRGVASVSWRGKHEFYFAAWKGPDEIQLPLKKR